MFRIGRRTNYATAVSPKYGRAGGRDAAQAQAGHADGSMTERYARPTLGDAAEIIEKIG